MSFPSIPSACLLLFALVQSQGLHCSAELQHGSVAPSLSAAFVRVPNSPFSTTKFAGICGSSRILRPCPAMSLSAGDGDKKQKLAGKKTVLQISSDKSESIGYTDVEDGEETDEVMSMMVGLDQEERPSDKVRVFGANLDSKFASRGRGLQNFEDSQVTEAMMQKALAESRGDLELAKKNLRKNLQRLQDAEDKFRAGVNLMKSGQYQASIKNFMDAIAITPDGPLSREGGQYTIWLSQALAAKGDRAQALLTVRTLRSHEDRDIRRVAGGVEYIYSAPELEVGEEHFQWIEIEKLEAIKEGPKQRLYAKMKKMPEKYSLEWYMLQKPTKKEIGNGQDTQLAIAGTAVVLAALAAYGSLGP